MNYKNIIYTLGWVLNFEAICMILPLICALIYHEPYIGVFAICIAICLFFGLLMTFKKPKNRVMYAKEGFVTVALSWIIISVFGALPFVFSGYIPNYIDALFETASGFSTTGASVLSNVEILPKALLFWRSFTHWIGGMGVLVFLVAVLPLSGGNNLYLMKAESTGPSVSKLVPKVRQTAKILYGLYIFFTVLEVIMLLFGRLNLFEALTLSFGTAGTGGFGVKNTSIAEYSAYIQWTITVFMIIFGVNFALYYLILMRKFKEVLASEELKVYIGVIIASTLLICINCRGLYENIFSAIRHSAFQVGSILTTTGFSTTDFDKWPELSKVILVLLMISGACAGSTGGGIKIMRIIVLLKTMVKEIKISAHPRSIHKINMNGKMIEHETVRAVNVFMVAYLVIFLASLFIISLDNFGFTTNFTAVLASLNNIGPGLEGVGPTQNFAAYSNLSKIVLTFCMLAGRLEIFPLLVLFSPYSWKK